MSGLSEFQIIDRFFRRPAPGAILGVGDDAALLAPTPGCELAVSVDMLVAGRHFFADVDPEALGHKALAVNLSDLAAMGARPRWALLAGALPEADPEWLARFARGFFALAERYEVDLVGGDTTRGPLNLCITILGEAPAGQALRRSGARAGDRIWISGTLGAAALALQQLLGRVTLPPGDFASCEEQLLRPQPRVELGLRLLKIAASAIDVSDGLLSDLAHVLDASAVGADIDLARIPRAPALDRLRDNAAIARHCVLAGGDDYELCFTAAPAHDPALHALSAELGLALTPIGTITADRALVVREDGVPLPELPRGFDHFAS
jgi:thiamine-monophosphate kinase